MKKSLQMSLKKILPVLLSVSMCASLFSVPAMAEESDVTSVATYDKNGYSFQKISHADKGVKKADGLVDYTGNGTVAAVDEGQGDRGQSYSWAALGYGDYMYIGTCYAAMGSTLTLMGSSLGDSFDAETMEATLKAMFNGNFYYGEEDGGNPGGIFVKLNIKTGEVKLIMSKSLNGYSPMFRNAIEYKGKLYFCGSVNSLPSIYEIDPETDEFKLVHQGMTLMEFYQTYMQGICSGIRGMTVHNDKLIVSCVGVKGPYILMSEDPSQGFTEIAGYDDLFGYPAYHYCDSIYGGSIWEMASYNGHLYVSLCTGTPDNKPDSNTMQSFAVVRGDENADGTYTWTSLIGDKKKDGAKYCFGIDPERTRAGAGNLYVYNGYLYIAEYNDEEIALENVLFDEETGEFGGINFSFMNANLKQSVSLYRMDENENIELVVGDKTKMFPKGSLTGIGSGFGHHENQYLWRLQEYDGKLYIGTFDTSSLLEPVGQLSNGDLLKMTKEEWTSQINYIKVLLQLLMKDSETETESLEIADKNADAAPSEAENEVEDEIPVTENVEEEVTTDANTEETTEESLTEAVMEATEEVLDEKAAEALVEEAVIAAVDFDVNNAPAVMAEASGVDESDVPTAKLSKNQMKEAAAALLEGKLTGLSEEMEVYADLALLATCMSGMAGLVETNDLETFSENYEKALILLDTLADENEGTESGLAQVIELLKSVINKKNLERFKSVIECLAYMSKATRGFDLYTLEDGENGLKVETVTTNGLGDPYNHGLRVYAVTNEGLCIGTANPFYGTQVWLMNSPKEEEKTEEETEETAEPEENTYGTDKNAKDEIAEDITEAAEDTTEAEEETTEAAEDITEAEEETTEAVEDITEVEEETTEIAEDTTEAEEETTEVAEDATEAEEETTEAEEETTALAENTTDADDEETTEAEASQAAVADSGNTASGTGITSANTTSAKGQTAAKVNTGDNASPMVYVFAGIGAVCVFAALVFAEKRKNTK